MTKIMTSIEENISTLRKATWEAKLKSFAKQSINAKGDS